ncbi:MAG: IspD/TarI family cytidylyltransferase [Bacillota bacterium]
MNIAVILAGGVGSRLGADRPKQFIEVLGKPIIVYTIEAFQENDKIDFIEVVCVKSHINYMYKLLKQYNLTKVEIITEGGKDFQNSVINGLVGLDKKCSNEDIVLVHFGASPFIEKDIISDAIVVCQEKGNAISTIPFYVLAGIKDDDTKSSTWIDRDSIACMSSPHAFKYGYITDLYDRAMSTGVIDKVEPHTTTLMHKMGETIYFSKGSQCNIKITTKEDLMLFEGYLLAKERREKSVDKQN